MSEKGFSAETVDIMCQSWSSSTIRQYNTYFKKWILFCEQRKTQAHNSNMKELLDFFTTFFQNGLSYSAVNTAKAALQTQSSAICSR